MSSENRNEPEKRKVIYTIRAACPDCGSVKVVAIASRSNGYGSRTKPMICKNCDCRFINEEEVPAFFENGIQILD